VASVAAGQIQGSRQDDEPSRLLFEITIYGDTSANFSCKSGLRRPKAAEDCRSPRRFANTRGIRILECASLLAL